MTWVWTGVLVIAVAAFLAASYKLFGIDRVKNWLLWAVTEAEAIYGSGTGKIKLAYVYNIFISKFPVLQVIIPYSLFARLVDIALEKMRDMLKNDKIRDSLGVN